MAKEADIPWSTVRNMFKRDTEPSISTLECLCNALGITMSQFFEEENALGLTQEQQRLLSGWNRLDAEDKKIINALVVSLEQKEFRQTTGFKIP